MDKLNLDNTKYWAQSVEDSKKIQKFLFDNGYVWESNPCIREPKYLYGATCFYANPSKTIGWATYRKDEFVSTWNPFTDKTNLALGIDQTFDTTSNITLDNIYKDFIDDVGIDGQMLQAIEEMNELTKELLKYIRYDTYENVQVDKLIAAKNNMIAELGDVYNALGSLEYILINKLKVDLSDLHEQRIEKLYKYHNKNYKKGHNV